MLVGPEGGYGGIAFLGAEHGAGGVRALVLGVAPGLKADAAVAIERMRKRAAVAGREDVGVVRVQLRIDANAVLDVEPAGLRERRLGHRADARDDRVAAEPRPIGEQNR